MEMVEIVIKIPKYYLTHPQDYTCLAECVRRGVPLPKGHGRLIDQDRMIARLEAASKYFSDENTDVFDERLSYGFKEAAIKVAGALTIIEADRRDKE